MNYQQNYISRVNSLKEIYKNEMNLHSLKDSKFLYNNVSYEDKQDGNYKIYYTDRLGNCIFISENDKGYKGKYVYINTQTSQN